MAEQVDPVRGHFGLLREQADGGERRRQVLVGHGEVLGQAIRVREGRLVEAQHGHLPDDEPPGEVPERLVRAAALVAAERTTTAEQHYGGPWSGADRRAECAGHGERTGPEHDVPLGESGRIRIVRRLPLGSAVRVGPQSVQQAVTADRRDHGEAAVRSGHWDVYAHGVSVAGLACRLFDRPDPAMSGRLGSPCEPQRLGGDSGAQRWRE
ncbi:hypothetical protein ACFV2U_53725 [Streptomyces sp. NPDC059697]|uniref:hypothetical protein n=1 Tax=Streptomyces sp. NPDC059697 TaxID=3346912 RepID=UPI0036B1EC40